MRDQDAVSCLSCSKQLKLSNSTMVKSLQPGRKRHIPQRTCIACRRTDSKRQLVRVVRTTDRGVLIDPTGKVAGRGAYLCKVQDCWNKGLKGSVLGKALKTTLTEVDMAALLTYARSLPTELEAAAADATVQPA